MLDRPDKGNSIIVPRAEESDMAKCPYCKKTVTLAEQPSQSAGLSAGDGAPVRKEVVGRVKKEVMYSCPHCELILGFSFFPGGALTGRP